MRTKGQTLLWTTLILYWWASLVAQLVRSPPIVKMWVWSLGRQDPLEEGMATHSSILAWRIPWTKEPGGLQSIGLHSVEHWSDWTCILISFITHISWNSIIYVQLCSFFILISFETVGTLNFHIYSRLHLQISQTNFLDFLARVEIKLGIG